MASSIFDEMSKPVTDPAFSLASPEQANPLDAFSKPVDPIAVGAMAPPDEQTKKYYDLAKKWGKEFDGIGTEEAINDLVRNVPPEDYQKFVGILYNVADVSFDPQERERSRLTTRTARGVNRLTEAFARFGARTMGMSDEKTQNALDFVVAAQEAVRGVDPATSDNPFMRGILGTAEAMPGLLASAAIAPPVFGPGLTAAGVTGAAKAGTMAALSAPSMAFWTANTQPDLEREMVEAGVDRSKARVVSLAAAGLMALVEQWNPTQLPGVTSAIKQQMANNAKGTLRRWAIDTVKQYGMEWGEETLQAGLNLASKAATEVLDDNAAYNWEQEFENQKQGLIEASLSLPFMLAPGVAASGAQVGYREYSQGKQRAEFKQFLDSHRESKQEFVKNIVTPETAQQYIQSLPEEAGLLAQIEQPSRKDWQDLMPTPYMPSAEQRKQFAELVREEFNNAPEKRYERWAAARQNYIDSGLTPEQAGELARINNPLSKAEELRFTGWTPPAAEVSAEAPTVYDRQTEQPLPSPERGPGTVYESIGEKGGRGAAPGVEPVGGTEEFAEAERRMPEQRGYGRADVEQEGASGAEVREFTQAPAGEFEVVATGGELPDPRTTSQRTRDQWWETFVEDNTGRFINLGLSAEQAEALSRSQADEARWRWETGTYRDPKALGPIFSSYVPASKPATQQQAQPTTSPATPMQTPQAVLGVAQQAPAAPEPSTPTVRQEASEGSTAEVVPYIKVESLSDSQITQIANEVAQDNRPYRELVQEAKEMNLLTRGEPRTAPALRARIAEAKVRKQLAQTQPLPQQQATVPQASQQTQAPPVEPQEAPSQRTQAQAQAQTQEQRREPTQRTVDSDRPPLSELGATGTEARLITAEGKSRKVKYVAVEAQQIIPSHDARRSFTRNEAADENERPYHDPKQGAASRSIVLDIAKVEPDKILLLLSDTHSPIDGPPIVTDTGVVLGGNARSMGIQLAYHNGGEAAVRLKQATVDAAAKFGIDGTEVANMKQPVIVRIIDVPGNRGELSALLNETLAAGKSQATIAVSQGKRVSEKTARLISAMLEPEALEDPPSLRDLLASPAKAERIIQALGKDNVWSDREMDLYIDPTTGSLNADGKTAIEQLLMGRLISDPSIIGDATPGVRQKLIAALGPLVRGMADKKHGARITQVIKDAVDSFRGYKAESLPLERYFMGQRTMFQVPGAGDYAVAAIVHALDTMGPLKFKRAIDGIVRSLGIKGVEQSGSLFADIEETVDTIEEAIKQEINPPLKAPALQRAADLAGMTPEQARAQREISEAVETQRPPSAESLGIVGAVHVLQGAPTVKGWFGLLKNFYREWMTKGRSEGIRFRNILQKAADLAASKNYDAGTYYTEYEQALASIAGRTKLLGRIAVGSRDYNAVNAAIQSKEWATNPRQARRNAISTLQANWPKATPEKIARLADAIAAMRNHVDANTTYLMRLGILPEALQVTLDENLGVWLTRTYRYWDDPKHAKNVMSNPVLFSRLTNWFRNYLTLPTDLDTVPFRQQYNDSGIGSFATRQEAVTAAIRSGFRDHDVRLDHGLWKVYRPAFAETIRSLAHRHGIPVQGGMKRQDIIDALRRQEATYTEQDFRNLAEEFVTNPLFAKRATAGGGMSTSPANILKKRSDLLNNNALLRQALGEYEDPGTNFVRSIDRIANVIAYAEASQTLATVGLSGAGQDRWFYRDGETRPDGYAYQLHSDNVMWQSLNGLWTTEIISKALHEQSMDRFAPWLARAYFRSLSYARATKTIMNIPMGPVRNFISNPFLSFANGHAWRVFSPSGFRNFTKSFSGAIASTAKDIPVSQRLLRAQTQHEFARKMYRLGVFDSQAEMADMRGLLKEAQWGTPWEMAENMFKRRAARVMRGMGSIWTAMDNVWKGYEFLAYRDDAKRAFPHYNSEQLDEWAAARVKNTMPTAANSPRLLELIRKAPVGPFPTFGWEVMRNTCWAYRYAVDDWKNGATPQIRQQGAIRFFAATSAIFAIPALLRYASMAFWGVEPEEDRENKRFRMPEWTGDRVYVHVGLDENGVRQYHYIDMSYTLPHTYITEPIYSLAESLMAENMTPEERVRTGLWEATKKFFDPFVAPDILPKAVAEAAVGKTTRGGIVRTGSKPMPAQTWEGLTHVWNQALEPGFISRLRRIGRGYRGDVNKMGEPYSFGAELSSTFLGARIQSVSPQPLLYQAAKRYSTDMGNKTSDLSRVTKTLATIDLKDIGKTYRTVENSRYRLWREMFTNVQAARRSGMSAADIYDTITQDQLIGQEEARRLIDGIYVPYNPGRRSMEMILRRPDGEKRLEELLSAIGDRRAEAEAGALDLRPRQD